MTIRIAEPHEARALAALINAAFVVEAFFKIGDRTSAEEVAALMADGGEFLVLQGSGTGAGTGAGTGTLMGCVYLKYSGDRCYLGMLSIDPPRQRQGLGLRMVDAAEARARARGCRFMDMHIVNVREELPPYYRRLGYADSGTLPFSDCDQASRPCFFIVMSKRL